MPFFILVFAIASLVALETVSSRTALVPYFGYVIPIFFLAICVLLPRIHAVVTAAILLAVVALLTLANSTKIAFTQLPLTTMDFYVFWSGPEGVVDVLDLPAWTGMIVKPASVVLLLGFALAIADGFRARLSQPKPGRVVIVVALAVSTIAVVFVQRYIRSVSTFVIRENSVWQPERASELSRQMGVVGFLTYSYYVASVDPGDYLSSRTGPTAPSDGAIVSAAASYVTPIRDPQKLLPNIVVLFGESTFNPFYSFEVQTRESFPLFQPTVDTQALGPLHVNTVGGGSWISEFESLVGIDARLFGYAGYYPHSALSPYIRKSLPTKTSSLVLPISFHRDARLSR